MQFDRTDLIRYFYTVGVLLSGIYLNRVIPGGTLQEVFLIGIFVAIPWALYYKFTVVPKIEMVHETGEGGSD